MRVNDDRCTTSIPDCTALVPTDPPLRNHTLRLGRQTQVRPALGAARLLWFPVVSFGDFRLIAKLAQISGAFRYELVWEKKRPVGFLDSKKKADEDP